MPIKPSSSPSRSRRAAQQHSPSRDAPTQGSSSHRSDTDRPPMVIRHYFDEPALPESPFFPLRSAPPLPTSSEDPATSTPDNPHQRSSSALDPGLFDYVAYLSPPSPPSASAHATPSPLVIPSGRQSPSHLSPLDAEVSTSSHTKGKGKSREKGKGKEKLDQHGRPAHPVQAALYAAHGKSPIYTTASDFSSAGGISELAWESSPDASSSAATRDKWPKANKTFVWKRDPEEEARPRLDILHDPKAQSPPEKYASAARTVDYDLPDEYEEEGERAGSPSSMFVEAAYPHSNFPSSSQPSGRAEKEKKSKGKGKVSSWFSRKKGSSSAQPVSPTSPGEPMGAEQRKRSIFTLGRSRTKSAPRNKGKGRAEENVEEEARDEIMEEDEERMKSYMAYLHALQTEEAAAAPAREAYAERSKSMIDLSAPLPPLPADPPAAEVRVGGFTEEMQEAMERERQRLPEKFREGFNDLDVQEADLAEIGELPASNPPAVAASHLKSLRLPIVPPELKPIAKAGASPPRSVSQPLRPSTSTGSLVPSRSLFNTTNRFARSTTNLASLDQRSTAIDSKRLTAQYGWMTKIQSPMETTFPTASIGPRTRPPRPISSSERIHAAASSRAIGADASLRSDTSRDGLRVLDLEGNFAPKLDEIGRLVEESEAGSPEVPPRLPDPPPAQTLPIPPKSSMRPGTALRNLRIDTSKIGPALQKIRQSSTSAALSSEPGSAKTAVIPRSASESDPFYRALPSGRSDVDPADASFSSTSSGVPQSRSSNAKLARMLGPEFGAPHLPPLKVDEGGKEVKPPETQPKQLLEKAESRLRLPNILDKSSKKPRKDSVDPSDPPSGKTKSKRPFSALKTSRSFSLPTPGSKTPTPKLTDSQSSQQTSAQLSASTSTSSSRLAPPPPDASTSSFASRKASAHLSSSTSAPLAGSSSRKASAVSASSSLPAIERRFQPKHPFALTRSPYIAEKQWTYGKISFLDLRESPPPSPKVAISEKYLTVDFALQILDSWATNLPGRRASPPLVDLSFLDELKEANPDIRVEEEEEQQEEEIYFSEASGVNTPVPLRSRSDSGTASPPTAAPEASVSSEEAALSPDLGETQPRDESPSLPPESMMVETSSSTYLRPPLTSETSHDPDLGDKRGSFATIRRPSSSGIFGRRKSSKPEPEAEVDEGDLPTPTAHGQVDSKRVMEILAGRSASSTSLSPTLSVVEGLPSRKSSTSTSLVSIAEIRPSRPVTTDKGPKEIWYAGEYDREVAIRLAQISANVPPTSQYPHDAQKRAEVQRLLPEFPTTYEQIKVMPHEEVIVHARVHPPATTGPAGLGERIGSRFRGNTPSGPKWEKVHLVLTHLTIRHDHGLPSAAPDEEWMKDISPRHREKLNLWKTRHNETIMHLHLFPSAGEITNAAPDGIWISDDQKKEINRRPIDTALSAMLGRVEGPEMEYGEPRVRRSVMRVNWGADEGDWFLELPADRAEMWVGLINDFARTARKEARDLARYQKSLLDAPSAAAYEISHLHKAYGLPGGPKHPGDHDYAFEYDNCDEETYIGRALAAGHALEGEACRPPIEMYPPPKDWSGRSEDWENPIWRMKKEKTRREEGMQLPFWAQPEAWDYPTRVGRAAGDGRRIPATRRQQSVANRKQRRAQAIVESLKNRQRATADASQTSGKITLAASQTTEDISPVPFDVLSLPPSAASQTSSLPLLPELIHPQAPADVLSMAEGGVRDRVLPPPLPPPTIPLPPLPMDSILLSLNLETPRPPLRQAAAQAGPSPATLNLIRAFPPVPATLPSMERLQRAMAQADLDDAAEETPRAPARSRPTNVLRLDIAPASLQSLQSSRRAPSPRPADVPLPPSSSQGSKDISNIVELANDLKRDVKAALAEFSSRSSARSAAHAEAKSVETARQKWKKPRSAGAVDLSAEINAIDAAEAAEHASHEPPPPVYDPSKRSIRFGANPRVGPS